tara:strand:- start:423 stop:803 length:381 start_codon:yes stop_codon:yes gene_type:complete
MSTLRADTIQSTGGGPVTLTKQSAAKVWHHYNQSGTLATVDSFNVSGATDSGVGVTRTSYINVLANVGYAVSGSHNLASGNTASWVSGYDNSGDLTTGQVTCSTFNAASGRADATKAMMAIHGDLA